jgi:hypothetical protein
MLNNLETDIEKAADLSHGGKLVPKFILVHGAHGIHKRLTWVKKDEVTDEHLHVKEGDVALYNGEEHTIVGVKDDGYVKLKDQTGRRHDKSPNKLVFPHDGEGSAPITPEGEVKPSEKKVVSDEDEGGLDYDIYGSPAERMIEWEKMVSNFADDKSLRLSIASGSGGVGKTFTVLQNTKIKEGLENGDVVKFTGGTTPGGFFEMLYNNKDKKIILDDFDMVFDDPAMLNILTSISSNTGSVTLTNPKSGNVHEKTSDGVPPRFDFDGSVMLISNVNLDKQAEKHGPKAENFQRILTNSDNLNLRLTKKETWDLLNDKILHDGRKMINGIENPNYGKINSSLKFQDALGNKVEVTDEEKESIANYFAKNWRNLEELSGRTLTKCNAIRDFFSKKGMKWEVEADKILLKDKPEMSIVENFDSFYNSLDMVTGNQVKCAVVADTNANNVTTYLKQKGMQNSHEVCTLQKQQNLEYEPEDGEEPVSNQYVVISSAGGGLTEKSLYETLFKHNFKTIVFDNSADKVLESNLGQGLLKGALDTSGDGEVAWLTSVNTGRYKPDFKPSDFEDNGAYGDALRQGGWKYETDEESGKVDPKSITHPNDLPEKFQFKGKCVFITSSLDNAPQPIQSRSMLANIKETPDTFIERSKYLINKREQLGIGFTNLKGQNYTYSEYKDALNFMAKNIDKIKNSYKNEEGVIKCMHFFRSENGNEENVVKKLMKSLDSGSLFIVDVDIEKAFNSLIL